MRDFKRHYLGEYKDKVEKDDLNKRRLTAVEREHHIGRTLGLYKMLNEEDQLEKVLEICHDFGSINSKNIVGRFEREIQANIADLDDELDELKFDDEM